jgi:DNA-directed RNA polymerases I, II, and III subunit RPABC1
MVAAYISTMLDRTTSVESHHLFLACCTMLELLHEQGYAISDDELTRTLLEFHAWWEDKPKLERLAFPTTLASTHPIM